jgi:phenylpropionate dioxygenase-like ring-hydroxylating dioxygenase large terminal subunit
MAISKTADCVCPYHGWLFDIHGQCLEMPAEPKGSKFCEKVKHLAYPVRELGGLIFAYMGADRDNPPPLPNYAPLLDRGGQRQIEPVRQADYNWFNFFEKLRRSSACLYSAPPRWLRPAVLGRSVF